MTRLLPILQAACRSDIACSALKISLAVGTILNLVNQGDVLIDGGPINWSRGLLNFVVPYCVSSYSAALNAIRECRENKQ